jgi:hypothetical protein
MTEAARVVVVETVSAEEANCDGIEEKMLFSETDPPLPEETKADQKEEWDRLARELPEEKPLSLMTPLPPISLGGTSA